MRKNVPNVGGENAPNVGGENAANVSWQKIHQNVNNSAKSWRPQTHMELENSLPACLVG